MPKKYQKFDKIFRLFEGFGPPPKRKKFFKKVFYTRYFFHEMTQLEGVRLKNFQKLIK